MYVNVYARKRAFHKNSQNSFEFWILLKSLTCCHGNTINQIYSAKPQGNMSNLDSMVATYSTCELFFPGMCLKSENIFSQNNVKFTFFNSVLLTLPMSARTKFVCVFWGLFLFSKLKMCSYLPIRKQKIIWWFCFRWNWQHVSPCINFICKNILLCLFTTPYANQSPIIGGNQKLQAIWSGDQVMCQDLDQWRFTNCIMSSARLVSGYYVKSSIIGNEDLNKKDGI